MSESIWITTTTTPDGTFDIFQFMVWLHSATLLELYGTLALMDQLANTHTDRWAITFGEAQEEAAQMAEYYNNLHHLIGIEACDRTDAAFKSQHPN